MNVPTHIMTSGGIVMNTQTARNQAVRESKREANDQAAVIFMVNWMKRKGVTRQAILDLGVWSEAERQHIVKIYRYSY